MGSTAGLVLWSVAARAKHFLRRYTVLQQRIRGQQCQVFKIDDPNMPADFLTKWMPQARSSATALLMPRTHATAFRSRDFAERCNLCSIASLFMLHRPLAAGGMRVGTAEYPTPSTSRHAAILPRSP